MLDYLKAAGFREVGEAIKADVNGGLTADPYSETAIQKRGIASWNGLRSEMPFEDWFAGFFRDEMEKSAATVDSGLKDISGAMEDGTKDITKTAKSGFEVAGEESGSGFINAWEKKADDIYDSISRVMSGAVQAAQRIVQVNSPSKVFENIGKFVGEGFIQGVDGMSGKIAETMDSVFGGLDRSVSARIVPEFADVPEFAARMTPVSAGTPPVGAFEADNTQVVRHEYTGTIRHEGINNRGEFLESVDMFIEEMLAEKRLST